MEDEKTGGAFLFFADFDETHLKKKSADILDGVRQSAFAKYNIFSGRLLGCLKMVSQVARFFSLLSGRDAYATKTSWAGARDGPSIAHVQGIQPLVRSALDDGPPTVHVRGVPPMDRVLDSAYSRSSEQRATTHGPPTEQVQGGPAMDTPGRRSTESPSSPSCG